MRRRQHPAKWPLVITTALALFISGVFFTPQAWIDFFFSPFDLATDDAVRRAAGWLILLPPPEIEIAAPTPEPEPEQEPDPPSQPEWRNPDWWREGWNVRVATETESALRPAPEDSARVVLEALGIGEDFMTRVRPDSVLAQRLHLLRIEDSFLADELKPFLSAMGRSKQYRDMMSRKADMFDSFLSYDIVAPEIPAREDEEN